jgi:hypothetical protein
MHAPVGVENEELAKTTPPGHPKSSWDVNNNPHRTPPTTHIFRCCNALQFTTFSNLLEFKLTLIQIPFSNKIV